MNVLRFLVVCIFWAQSPGITYWCAVHIDLDGVTKWLLFFSWNFWWCLPEIERYGFFVWINAYFRMWFSVCCYLNELCSSQWEAVWIFRCLLRKCVEICSCVYYLRKVKHWELLNGALYLSIWMALGSGYLFLRVFGDVYPRLSAVRFFMWINPYWRMSFSGWFQFNVLCSS